jgi:hypothetical protein
MTTAANQTTTSGNTLSLSGEFLTLNGFPFCLYRSNININITNGDSRMAFPWNTAETHLQNYLLWFADALETERFVFGRIDRVSERIYTYCGGEGLNFCRTYHRVILENGERMLFPIDGSDSDYDFATLGNGGFCEAFPVNVEGVEMGTASNWGGELTLAEFMARFGRPVEDTPIVDARISS